MDLRRPRVYRRSSVGLVGGYHCISSRTKYIGDVRGPSVTNALTHWGRVTHICVIKLITIGSDNGLSPGRRQAIIWTNVGILLIGPLGANFSEILMEIIFSFKKMLLKVSSGKWRPFCLGLNELMYDRGKSPLWPIILWDPAGAFYINSLWPNDSIWWHRIALKLAQVMACCLMAMLINHQWGAVIFIWGQFHNRYLSH